MDKEYNNKKYKLLIILILLFLFSYVIFNIRFNNDDETIEIVDTNKINLLDDYNRFFTINSCIYKYITYLQTKNVDSILKVLDETYITNNNINKNNVLEYVDTLNGTYSFVSKKIYYEQLDDYNIKYYVYGYLVEDLIDSYGKKIDKYYIVLFDTNKNLFSITPFNEIEFKEVTNG